MKKLVFIIIAMLLFTEIYPQWLLQTSNTTDRMPSIYPVNPSIVFAVGGDLILKTTNAGTNWYKIREGSRWGLVDIYFVNENTGFIAGWGEHIKKESIILKTTNCGINWDSTKIDSIWFTSVFFINSTTGFAGGWNFSSLNSLLYRTSNAGINWYSIQIQNLNYAGEIFFIDENTGWMTCGGSNRFDGKIAKTTNGGNDWFISSSLYNICPTSVFFVNQNTGWLTCREGQTQIQFIKKSTDGGLTWINQLNHCIGWAGEIYFTDENTGWVAGQYPSLQKTTNGGINWYIQPCDALGLIDIKFINVNTGWASGNDGKIFYTTNSGGPVSIQNISTETPSKYSLSQNYPNPFNSMCNVQFSMCNAGNVKLVVYDIMGKEVQTLVNEKLQPGTYEAAFDGSMLNSGVYFYKLTTGTFSETKKMLLIK